MQNARALLLVPAMLLLAACSAAHPAAHNSATNSLGTVSGKLVMEGGPVRRDGSEPQSRLIPGTVQFTGGHHQPVMVRVGSTGVFSVQLPPGRYEVSDRSPRLLLVTASGRTRQTWSRPVPVTVITRHTTRITLTSIVP